MECRIRSLYDIIYKRVVDPYMLRMDRTPLYDIFHLHDYDTAVIVYCLSDLKIAVSLSFTIAGNITVFVRIGTSDEADISVE